MPIQSIVILVNFIINLILLFTMIFVERKQPQTIFSWLVILSILPIGGFFLYLLFGGGLSVRTRLLIRRTKRYTTDYYKYIARQKIDFDKLRSQNQTFDYAYDLISFVKNCDECTFSYGNKVELFLDGNEKIERLKQDLINAKHSINIEYYIFDDDKIGKEIMNILCQKAKSGVKVKLIYDSIGCLKAPRSFFKQLKKCGGDVVEFFPPFMGIRLINLKINYRNHRKIVVIDGKIGYTGGINIRDDHLGKNKRLTPWRDTHIRIEGKTVWDLQNIFFNDWRCCKKKKTNLKELVEYGYFNDECLKTIGNIGAQVITSGPESSQKNIQDVYIKMLSMAKKRIYIQTPYFIPDELFFKTLVIAKKSGIDVKVMIPKIPDKKSVYYATLSFVRQLLDYGIDVYLYKGFIHAKTLLVDDLAVSIGTCNIDNRSFALNFELTTLLYNKDFVNINKQIFERDINNSERISIKYFKRKFVSTKIMQAIFRLFSQLM